MTGQFDPYHVWLGIPPAEQPAHYYRLLGISVFEANPDVIESAADKQMAHLRTFQAGKNSALSQTLLNEVAAAKICLLNPPQKAAYDQRLRETSRPDDALDSGLVEALRQAEPNSASAPRKHRQNLGILIGAGAVVVVGLIALLAMPRQQPVAAVRPEPESVEPTPVAKIEPPTASVAAKSVERPLVPAQPAAQKSEPSKPPAGESPIEPPKQPAAAKPAAEPPKPLNPGPKPVETKSVAAPGPAAPPVAIASPQQPAPAKSAALPPATAPKRKQAVPGEAALTQARKAGAALFAAETEQAKTSAEKGDLAKRLLAQTLAQTGDPAGEYVLLLMAQDLAVAAKDAQTAFQVVDQMAEAFEVDRFALKTGILVDWAKEARTTDARKWFVEQAIGVGDEALDAGNLEAAKELGKLATNKSSGLHEKNLVQKLKDYRQRFTKLQNQPALVALHSEQADPDSDRDGLSDFQEVHKYRTDPKNATTAGKGLSDGQWDERREFTYSIRAVIRVMRPYNVKTLNDDYQDARVLAENKEYAELEVVVYPLNSNVEAIQANPNWRRDDIGMKEYLTPGVTTNWDAPMRNDLLRELAGDGIHPDRLTDKELVEKVSRWLFRHSKSGKMFCTFYVGFPNGKPAVPPGLEQAFERDKGDPAWTVQQQLEHELFGKQMFASKTHGSCTSTAIYETTVLRALGIPTRMILCIPLADASDAAQVAMVEKGLTHSQVRSDVVQGVTAGHGSFSSHTFCEVFVGGRWRRLNSSTLGQNVVQPRYLGLMIKVHTFKDLSEANLAATWGTRYAKGLRDEAFPHSNPYRLLSVSDHFGKYASVSNPPAAQERERERPRQGTWYGVGPAWKELGKVASSHRHSLNSFNHSAANYEKILAKSQPGSRVVLLFALDHWDKNIPAGYEDFLPLPWAEIEAALKKGETVERTGKARDREIVLLAAPTESQLIELIHKTKLL